MRSLAFILLAGIICGAGCGATARPTRGRPRRIAVQYHAGVLRETVSRVAVMPFDATDAAGKDISGLRGEYAGLLPRLDYNVRSGADLEKHLSGPPFAMNPKLKRTILQAARLQEIDAVLFGRVIVKPELTAHAVSLLSTSSGKVLWTVLGENASPADIIKRVKQEMNKAGTKSNYGVNIRKH